MVEVRTFQKLNVSLLNAVQNHLMCAFDDCPVGISGLAQVKARTFPVTLTFREIGQDVQKKNKRNPYLNL